MTVKGNIGKGMAALLAAVAVMAGCSKSVVEEPIDNDWQLLTGDKPLRFAAAVEHTATKAPVTGSALPAGSAFGVFAYYQPGNLETYEGGRWITSSRLPNIMKNQEVSYDGTTYTYSPLRYWPANEENTISFWAYYPYDASVTLSQGNTGSTYSSGIPSVHFTATDGSIDFMTSDLAPDYVYGTAAGTNPNVAVDGVVPMSFNHRLSQVTLKARTENAGSCTIKINSLRLLNVQSAGTYVHQPAGWRLDNSPLAYTVVNTEQTVTESVEAGTVKELGSLCLLPQTMSPEAPAAQPSLEITYTVLGPGESTATPWTKTVALSGSGPAAWAANQHVVYTLTIGPGELYVKATLVEDWTDGGTNSYTPTEKTFFAYEPATYRLYDAEGNKPTDWVNAYAAVAFGQDEYGIPLYSPLLYLETTTAEPLVLESDNAAVGFIVRTKNDVEHKYDYSAILSSVTIPAGTDVETEFYVVPVSESTPDQEAQVFLRGASGLPYWPYNASVLPGNRDNTSCYFYVVTPDEYHNSPKIYDQE